MTGDSGKGSTARWIGAALALAATGAPGMAQQVLPESEGRPRVAASRIEQAPLVDGNVRGESLWDAVPVATGFRQTRPFAGEPASERTEVRVAYTADTLYIAAICFDSEPKAIIVSDSRRDASLDDTDSFQVILDTFGDEQNGFVFGTNPAGIEYDAQVVQGGSSVFGGRSGGRRFQSAVSSFNLNWDAAWTVATQVGASAGRSRWRFRSGRCATRPVLTAAGESTSSATSDVATRRLSGRRSSGR